MMGPKSKTWFMESMWRDLPADVLKKVFTFLPIASLCRFRTLSKEWNRTISSPTFKHARASEEEYVLITPYWLRSTGSWVVLDVARNRYLTLSDAFLTEHVQRQVLVNAAGFKELPRTAVVKSVLAATDGGLFCARCIFKLNPSVDIWERSPVLYVCNPVLKTVKQLPDAPGLKWGLCTEVVAMATDRSSMEYEIFVVDNADRVTFNPESILVYESKTGRWRTAFYRPFSYLIWWHSLTIFNNNLYCITEKENSSRHGLVSYDKKTGVVSDLCGIDFPFALGSHLVVSNARLFCVIPVEDLGDGFPSVEIFEVDVIKRVSTRLTEMPQALLFWVLGHDLERKFDGVMARKINGATGSADCILIATFVGRCAAYSLSRKSWYQFPDHRSLLEEGCRTNRTHAMIYGSNNCLSLCAP